MDSNQHREVIRRLVAEAPDEPTYCEFKQSLSYASKKEKGELIKDVSSFANTDLEALGGYGYIIFGVSNSGQVVGLENLAGDPPSAVRQIVNGHLSRSVVFEYLTCEVDDEVGGTRRVAAIVVQDSRRRPHVVSREIKERLQNGDKFWLREGEIWVRKTGGREQATAEDIDAMYEGKLRRLVDERVQTLQERIELLERDLREHRSTSPKLGFGLAVHNNTKPSNEGQPYPVLGTLINYGEVLDDIKQAGQQAAATARAAETLVRTYEMPGPSSKDFEEYRHALEVWLSELRDLCVLEFMLVNTGRVPAEDVEVVLKLPAELRPREEIPEKPDQPQHPLDGLSSHMDFRVPLTKHNAPNYFVGPEIRRSDAPA